MAVKVPNNYDFCGYATRNDIRCSDGRTIRHNAFKECNGKKVPLVWNHLHNDMTNVIGHALLENRDDGVYCYGYLNDTDLAKNAREQLRHKDITSMSIFANHLKEKGGNVIHGIIREVSLVLAGANDGAYIDWVLEHGDDGEDGSAIIYPFIEDEYLYHKDRDEDDDDEEDEEDSEDEDDEESDEDEDDSDDEEDDEDMDDKKRIRHADEDSGETIGDVLDTLSEKQLNAVYALIGAMDEENGGKSDKEDDDVKHNAFESDYAQNDNYLSHADMEQILSDGKRLGSLKDAFLSHCEAMDLDSDSLMHDDTQSYGIKAIDALFPEYQNLNNPPEFIKRDTNWVPKVLNGAHHSPFSRIKSQYANITEDEARAKGYIKGKLKKEEVFSLLKRTTDPQTIYKKQKLDRDDIIDITDFDVVAWIKAEMRVMLDEEIARAVLIGDGRLSSDDDHISEDHVRSIWKDADLFTVKVKITVPTNATADDKAKALIRACLKGRKYYKGSGQPKMFTTEDMISDMLLLEDGIGHSLYETEGSLATKCRVSEIVPVELMEGATDATQGDLAAIIVNMSDYNIGADKGGAVSLFDDFDIDYNQQKYLIETRISGALTKPYSALAVSFKTDSSASKITITFSGDGMDEFAIEDSTAG